MSTSNTWSNILILLPANEIVWPTIGFNRFMAKSESLQMIINMARCQDVCFTLLCYYLSFLTVESKIFSKSLEDISLIQKSSLQWRENKENDRQRREMPSETYDNKISPFIHSQNLTLNTTIYSLGGENDNEVFVTWAGVNNEVSFIYDFNINLVLCSFVCFLQNYAWEFSINARTHVCPSLLSMFTFMSDVTV